jgi:hypothetical protein
MKNIILVILAILFIIIILFHFMNVQLEHFECNQNETSGNDAISNLFYRNPVSGQTIEMIQQIVNNRGNLTDDSLVQALINLGVSNSGLNSILNDKTSYPTSKDKLNVFKCAFAKVVKGEFDTGLLIHYPLDKTKSNSNIVENESINVKFNQEDKKYNATLKFEGNSGIPVFDYNDIRGPGSASMRFHGSSTTDGSFISIDKLPNFWDNQVTPKKFMGLSIAVWVKALPSNRHWSRIFDFALGQFYNNNIFATVTNTHDQRNGDVAFISMNGSSNDPDVISGITYTDGGVLDSVWRHYVFTISPTNDNGNINYKIFINGELTKSNYFNDTAADNTGVKSWTIGGPDPKNSKAPSPVVRTNNFIGKSNFPWDKFFDGWMADFRLYTIELSTDTVKRLYTYVNPVVSASAMFSPTTLAAMNGSVAIPSYPGQPGTPAAPSPKLNISMFADKNAITTDARGIVTWNDGSGFRNNAVASDVAVKFCPISNKITVPSGSYMDIMINPQCTYAAPVTIMVVADVKSFYPPKATSDFWANHVFSSNDNDGLWFGFTGNHVVVGIHNRAQIVKNLAMSGVNGNGVNIYILQLDGNAMAKFWINGNLVVNEKMLNGAINQNKRIRLGCSFEPFQYSSTDNIDYHQLVHCSGIFTEDYLRFQEAWMATAWGIKSKMNTSNPYLNYRFQN